MQMSEDLESRVARLELLYRGLDRDVASLQEQRRHDLELMRATREDVADMKVVQAEHSDVLGKVESGQHVIIGLLNELLGRRES